MAYVYMCMAGWPLNKGTEYYKLAAGKAKEVIDGVENHIYDYALLDEYSQVYSWEYNNKNKELLLGLSLIHIQMCIRDSKITNSKRDILPITVFRESGDR